MASPMLKEKQQPANGTPPQVRAATRQRAATHVGGGVPDAPETSRHRPSPGPPRAGHARPLPRGGGQAPCRPQTPAEGSRPLPTNRPINECPPPAASSRGYPSTGSHPRRGRRPRRPGNLPSPPIPGKTPGPGMPGPYRAAAGKPHAVRKRPRRGQDPSLRTDPSTSAGTYSAYVNYIRRAGCPHPAASSRGYPSTGSRPRRGRRPRRPGSLLPPPIPGKNPGPGIPAPYRAAVGKPYAIHKRPRRGQDPSLRTDPPTSAHTLPRGGGQAPCRP